MALTAPVNRKFLGPVNQEPQTDTHPHRFASIRGSSCGAKPGLIGALTRRRWYGREMSIRDNLPERALGLKLPGPDHRMILTAEIRPWLAPHLSPGRTLVSLDFSAIGAGRNPVFTSRLVCRVSSLDPAYRLCIRASAQVPVGREAFEPQGRKRSSCTPILVYTLSGFYEPDRRVRCRFSKSRTLHDGPLPRRSPTGS